MKKTEYKLTLWREGQTNAERFCADLLLLDGFSSVDPQCPLGGPDGLKDVVCEKNNWKYIGAAYFPTTKKTYSSIKNKFKHDLDGVSDNSADGIVFITNQSITPFQKKALNKLANSEGHKSIIYDNERIRVIIDSPIGFALRLQYLRIKMNKEEQLAFFAQQQNKLQQLLNNQSSEIIKALSKKIDECCQAKEDFKTVINDFISVTQSTMSQFLQQEKVEPSDKKSIVFPKINLMTSELTIDSLCNIHKLLLYESNIHGLGELRTHKVWVGAPSGDMKSASFIPPEPAMVKDLIDKILTEWRASYLKMTKANKDLKLKAISKFHSDFLDVHPFLDGNGRIARFLLNQQVSELLEIDRKIIIEDRIAYYSALTEAHDGNYEKLDLLLKQAIYGQE